MKKAVLIIVGVCIISYIVCAALELSITEYDGGGFDRFIATQLDITQSHTAYTDIKTSSTIDELEKKLRDHEIDYQIKDNALFVKKLCVNIKKDGKIEVVDTARKQAFDKIDSRSYETVINVRNIDGKSFETIRSDNIYKVENRYFADRADAYSKSFGIAFIFTLLAFLLIVLFLE